MSANCRRSLVCLVLLIAGYTALVAAWTVGNPLGRAPDEPAHYLRALAAGTGHIHGEHIVASPSSYPPMQRRWVEGITRNFSYPARLAIDQTVPCPLGNPTVSAACQRTWPSSGAARQTSNVGAYQPYAYVPIGAAIRVGPTRWTAYLFGRAAVAASSLALLTLAAFVLWQSRSGRTGVLHPLAVVGLLVGVTPMAVFLASTLNPSGLEVAAGVAFTVGVLSVLRDAEQGGPPRGAWLAFGLGGVVLAATRSLGPYFVATVVVLGALLVGIRRALDAIRAAPRAAAVAGSCIAVAAVLNLWWEASNQPRLTWTNVLDHATLTRIPRFGEELVGKFGWLEWHLPWPFYALWGLLVLALVVTALAVGSWRQRGVLLALIAGCIALAVAFNSVLPTQTGYDFQGRYLLALVVAIPLVAAEVIRRRHRFSGRVLAAGAAVGGVMVAVLQFVGWYLNAQRYAVGTSGPKWFAPHAQWSPVGGWILWMCIALAGSLCLASSAVAAAVPTLVRRRRVGRGPAEAPAARP